MRVSLQGCLILWLCFLSSGLQAAPFYVSADQWGKSDTWYSSVGEICSYLESRVREGYSYGSCDTTPIDTRNVTIGGTRYDNLPYSKYDIPVIGTGNPTLYAYDFANVDNPPTPCEPPNDKDPETGECRAPKEPEACYESGELFDPITKQCVTECPDGALNGACLPPPENNDSCTSESDDYRGEIVQGYGQSPISFCGDIDQCSGDMEGQIGLINGELRCIAKDYGAPSCKGDTIAVLDPYGFVCEPLTNKPEEPETPEAPNTDTDGDGEPDEYQRENDPESVDKGLDKVTDAINEGNSKTDKSNQHLSNIENAVKGIADNVASLEQMGKNGELAGGGGASGGGEGLKNEAGEDYLGDLADIKQNTKDTADTLTEIKDGPEGGYNTDGLGDAPTFSESSDRLQLAITGHPTIQAVTTIPSIASNNTCPVWTIPATDYWSAMPIDSHCQILTDHRGLLSMLFIAVWTLAAVFVFLRA